MRISMLIVLMLGLHWTAHAEEAAPAPAAQPGGPDKTLLRELIGEAANQVILKPAPLPAMYEAVIEGEIFYLSADGRYMVRGGDILDLKAHGKNLTEERRNGMRLQALQTLKPEDMVIFKPKGETKHILTVFTDVDCFYCAKLHTEMDKLNAAGVEVHYLAFPRAGVGSPTYQTMVSVWCADNRQQTMTDAKADKEIPSKTCPNPVASQYELGKQMGVSGTPALLMPDGELFPGYAPADKLVGYLNKKS